MYTGTWYSTLYLTAVQIRRLLDLQIKVYCIIIDRRWSLSIEYFIIRYFYFWLFSFLEFWWHPQKCVAPWAVLVTKLIWLGILLSWEDQTIDSPGVLCSQSGRSSIQHQYISLKLGIRCIPSTYPSNIFVEKFICTK